MGRSLALSNDVFLRHELQSLDIPHNEVNHLRTLSKGRQTTDRAWIDMLSYHEP